MARGGVVLATVQHFGRLQYVWWLTGKEAERHITESMYAAQRAARRALREGVVTTEQE
jgi:hypothetical protein